MVPQALKGALLLCTLASTQQAWAGALDLQEVGGPWGTPATGGSPGLWWNPATLSATHGTQLLIDVAPVIGTIHMDRDDPLHGGPETWRVVTAVPFVGVNSDFGVPGLGFGGAFYIPYARAGKSTGSEDVGGTHLRSAQIFAMHTSFGVSYAWRDIVGVGVSGTWVHATWAAKLDIPITTLLADQIFDTIPIYDSPADIYGDENVEDPNYLALADFQHLKHDTGTFQAGVFVRPHPRVMLSLGFVNGERVDHKGTLQLDLPCPPDTDTIGQIAMNKYSLCGTKVRGATVLGYRYPMRVHMGVQVKPTDDVTLEVLAGWTRWSEYKDFDILASGFTSDTAEITPEADALLRQDRKWARGNADTGWIGVDVKGQPVPRVTVGGRVTYDRHASQPGYLSPNTVDFDTLRLMVMGSVQVSKKTPLEIGLSFTDDVDFKRVETENKFRVNVDPAARVEDRLFFPTMNGTYSGSVQRIGVTIRGNFDAPKAKK
jgi:long-subunit fatty acid transport protein